MTASTTPSCGLSRRSAGLAIALVAPVPSIGVWLGLYATPGELGQLAFAACKLWLLVAPALCWLVVERQRFSWSPPRHGGLGVGLGLGLASAALIVGFFALMRGIIDPLAVRDVAGRLRLAHPTPYLAAATYYCLLNSLIEEYVFRWFLFTRLERLMPATAAVAASAAIFTAHHTLALATYLGWTLNLLASAGIFAASCLWSWLYLRYRSLWPPWLCHVLADVAVFAIGFYLLFG
jgi:membrane protease YdiL (CAAX protease family)